MYYFILHLIHTLFHFLQHKRSKTANYMKHIKHYIYGSIDIIPTPSINPRKEISKKTKTKKSLKNNEDHQKFENILKEIHTDFKNDLFFMNKIYKIFGFPIKNKSKKNKKKTDLFDYERKKLVLQSLYDFDKLYTEPSKNKHNEIGPVTFKTIDSSLKSFNSSMNSKKFDIIKLSRTEI